MKAIIRLFSSTQAFRLLLVSILLVFCTCCNYMKMDPPADVDKVPPAPAPPAVDNTCWMATAANMLAGAGYGNGATLQARAEDIYGDLITWQTSAANPTGKADGGWTDAALSWWLGSANNTWGTNPYTVVTVYGNKSPKIPWADANGAQFIGNELRRCQFVGLSISWPTAGASVGSGGHAITAWGDNLTDATLTTNPSQIRLTDSDSDDGGDVQSYTYDVFTSPNPGGANEGNGWYFDYDPNHPYIKHIVTLCPTDDPSDKKLTQKVVGSYKIHQSKKVDATDLHYNVGTDVNILTYKTTINWSTSNLPVIIEDTPRRNLTVDWDLADKPVPFCNWITITTEFILPTWNAIKYSNVKFTYPKTMEPLPLPSIMWEMKTPFLEMPDPIPNVTGGYVIGSYDIVNPEAGDNRSVIAEYRFIHEYSFNQTPEMHEFYLTGTPGYTVKNFQFGHSYGYLSPEELWSFRNWMTQMKEEEFKLDEKPIEIKVNWEGRLPYPEGEDIRGRIRELKER